MIETTRSGACLTLLINRPERRNALNNDMYRQLEASLQGAQADSSCSVVVLTGAQGFFTAGNDLSEFRKVRDAHDSPALSFLRTLAAVDLPIVAAVEGQAIGVGVTLLQHCDFVYAANDAWFSMPFVSLGLSPEGGSSLLLAQLVGARRAAEWLLLGRPFSAQEAHESGFITDIAPAGTVLERASATAQALAAQSAQALRDAKRVLRQSQAVALSNTFDAERDLFARRLASDEAQAAFTRFLERKRRPD